MALLLLMLIFISYSIHGSFPFDSLGFTCDSFSFVRSFVRSTDLFSSLRISSQTRLRLSIIVHLLYISFPGSTVCPPHDFEFHRVLIVLPVKVVIDTLINKTTPIAISQEQSFQRDIRLIPFSRLTV